ncbi:DnaJ-like chaperonin [Microbacterium phage Zagie]|nr:DnaJ-like chaperonin [Microbacterium phage Zagie]
MSEWPGRLTVGPIREWPGAHTRSRRSAPFRYGGKPVKLTTTLSELDVELRAVGAKDAELLVAIDPAKFRRDGRPYANAVAEHPGVILSFDIPKLGRVSYPCDTFTTWEDNLRAIVLSLEALRKVDRYGTTQHREQYRGFLAIEATAAPAGFANAGDARAFLARVSGLDASDVRTQLRHAQIRSHPDRGGDAAIFQRVSLAERKLRDQGVL